MDDLIVEAIQHHHEMIIKYEEVVDERALEWFIEHHKVHMDMKIDPINCNDQVMVYVMLKDNGSETYIECLLCDFGKFQLGKFIYNVNENNVEYQIV